LNPNNLAIILFAFAAGLFMSSITTWAQVGTNVTTPSGDTEEVPTLSDAIQTNLQSLTALIAAIIALIGLVVKSGILDPWVGKKKQEQFYTDAQMNFVTMKKALEDKVLGKFILDQISEQVPQEKRKQIIDVSMNVDDQINKTAQQLEYYYNHFKDKVGTKNMETKVNPDNNTALPREDRNIANELGPIPDKIGEKTFTKK
jgi:hypothetical protein